VLVLETGLVVDGVDGELLVVDRELFGDKLSRWGTLYIGLHTIWLFLQSSSGH